jgi:hypothetical protein
MFQLTTCYIHRLNRFLWEREERIWKQRREKRRKAKKTVSIGDEERAGELIVEENKIDLNAEKNETDVTNAAPQTLSISPEERRSARKRKLQNTSSSQKLSLSPEERSSARKRKKQKTGKRNNSIKNDRKAVGKSSVQTISDTTEKRTEGGPLQMESTAPA